MNKFWAGQWAIKLAQFQVSALFWISLAGDGNRPKTKQNTLLRLFEKNFSAEKKTFLNSIFYAVSCQKLSSLYSNQILIKETRLASFSFANVCLHPCENTVPMKIACATRSFFFCYWYYLPFQVTLLCDHLFNKKKSNRNWLNLLSFDAGKIHGNKFSKRLVFGLNLLIMTYMVTCLHFTIFS